MKAATHIFFLTVLLFNTLHFVYAGSPVDILRKHGVPQKVLDNIKEFSIVNGLDKPPITEFKINYKSGELDIENRMIVSAYEDGIIQFKTIEERSSLENGEKSSSVRDKFYMAGFFYKLADIPEDKYYFSVKDLQITGSIFPLALGKQMSIKSSYHYSEDDADKIQSCTTNYKVGNPTILTFLPDDGTAFEVNESSVCESGYSSSEIGIVSGTLNMIFSADIFSDYPNRVKNNQTLTDMQLEPILAAKMQSRNLDKQHEFIEKSKNLPASDKTKAVSIFKQAFELFQTGEFDAAVVQFKKGLEIDPANAIANYYLAETYVRQNNGILARQYYELARQFGGDSKEAVLAESRLRNLK